jgi:hypothetical protein
MLRSDESETAEPQNDNLSEESCGQPSESTSVAVSERAQQNDYGLVSPHFTEVSSETEKAELTRSNSLNPFAAFVK